MENKTEMRNLVSGENQETGVNKSCSICGKPGTRATKEVKALPHHNAAITSVDALGRNLPQQFAAITKYLGLSTIDFVTRKKFNAQLESIRAKLVLAREEHDNYAPEKAEESQKRMLINTLTQTLSMLGVNPGPNPDPESKGMWSPLTLADLVQIELGKLMVVKADVDETITLPGETEEQANLREAKEFAEMNASEK